MNTFGFQNFNDNSGLLSFLFLLSLNCFLEVAKSVLGFSRVSEARDEI